MSFYENAQAALAAHIMKCATNAGVEQRIRVDDGDLVIFHLSGEETSHHVLIVTEPDTGELKSIAIYPFFDGDMDDDYFTGETIGGVHYVYNGIGYGFIDTDNNGALGAATLIYRSPYFDTQETGNVS